MRFVIKSALFLCALWLGFTTGANAQCGIVFTPASVTPGAAAGSYTITVAAATTQTNVCTRVATSTADWLTITSGQNSAGAASSIGYAVTENLSGQSRTGSLNVTITATGKTTSLTVRQAGTNCGYSFSPASVTVPAKNVAAFLLRVTTKCAWSASTTASWISISNPGPFIGNGSLAIAVADNAGTSLRRGTIQVDDQAIQVQQSGVACAFAITPDRANLPSDAGTAKFAVDTDPACSWSAAASVSWMTLSSPEKSGPGTVTATLAANTTPLSRTASVNIGGKEAKITQAGVGILFSAKSIQNASSFAEGPLSPGEIIVIYGSGMGPTALRTVQTTADGMALTTNLGDTRVLFDGIPAPMFYSSSGQISAIVPYGVMGPVAHVTVEYLGISSTPVTVSVQPATPGIFTTSQSGTGQGAVRNQDFSLNGAGNAASAGQVLIVYWTGGGALSFPVEDGRLVSVRPPFPLVTFPVVATLGDVQARVIYAGAVPTLAPGILQVNLVVPEDAPKGDAVPLNLKVGGYSTQPGVTVAIQ